MSIWNTHAIDLDLAENGIWITDIAGDEEFLIASYSNKKHRAAMNDWLKRNSKKLKNGTISDEVANEFMIKAFCRHVLLGWKNVKDREGNEIEFSFENAYKLLSDPSLEPLLRDLEAASKDEASFRDEVKAEQAKNSKKR